MNRIEVPFYPAESHRLDSLKRGIEKVKAKFPDDVEFLPELPEGEEFFYQREESISVKGNQVLADAPIAVLNAVLALEIDPEITIEEMALIFWGKEIVRQTGSPASDPLLEAEGDIPLFRVTPRGIDCLFKIAKDHWKEVKGRLKRVNLSITPFRLPTPGQIHRRFSEGEKGVCLETKSKCVFAIVGAWQKEREVLWLAVPSDDRGMALIKGIESEPGQWLRSKLPPHVFAIDPRRLVDRIHFPSWLVAKRIDSKV